MRVLITGINGQDGSYLAELLLEKGYEVHGIIRRTSEPLMEKIIHLKGLIKLHYGDMTDGGSLNRVIREVNPDEIYNLAAMSHVRWSFENPASTFDINTTGLLRIIESVRSNELDCKIYQACSSEMFGKVMETPQTEKTPFYPRSPYGVSKAASYYMARTYREAYGMKIYCGILFNHESPRRGEEFLSRKVCKAAAKISRGMQDVLEIGNMEAKRDFGYAKEYVAWIHRMMQHPTPDDFVIGTGETHSVREWIELAFEYVGVPLNWEGEAENEVGKDEWGNVVVRVNPEFYRPAEVDLLLANPTKSREVLGFVPEVGFEKLVKIMTAEEVLAL